MILLRGLERVRPLSYVGYGAPLVLDHKRGLLTPYHGKTGEWDKTRDGRQWALSPAGLAVPVRSALSYMDRWMRGRLFAPRHATLGGFTGFLQIPSVMAGFVTSGTITFTSSDLDSAYTYNSAGDAVGFRMQMREAEGFNTIYYNISGYTGNNANVNDISVEVRNDSSLKPGSTLHDSIVSDPATATGWIQVTGFTFDGSANTTYWIAVADPDGNTTDFASVVRQVTVNLEAVTHRFGLVTSTNGFSTVSQGNNVSGTVVVKFDSGRVWGNPYVSTAAASSSTNRKGLRIGGFTGAIKLYGITCLNTVGSGQGEVYLNATAPGGSTHGTFTNSILESGQLRGFVGAAVELAAATAYRAVYQSGSATTVPTKVQIGTGANDDLRDAKLGARDWYYAEANGTSDWANDDTDAWPRMSLLVDDTVAASGGTTIAGTPMRRGMV